MEIGKTALGVAAALCITAGAGGAYLLTRGGDSVPGQTGEIIIGLDPTIQTVEQSEAIVAEDIESAPAVPSAPIVERRVAPARPAALRPRESTATVRPRESTRVPVRPEVPAEPAETPRWYPAVETRPATPVSEPVVAPEPEPERPAEPLPPQFVDLIVPADAVVGLQIETALTSERARVEDEVVAHVTRDVRVSDRVAIPAGSRVHGEVTLVERGGRVRERARLGIRFTSVVLADGTRIPLETEAIYREGDSPSGESAAKIGGGAIGGAIIGGILGGARGAVIGGSVGAGAGSAAVLAGGRNPATLPAGTPVTVRLTKPATVTVEN